MNDLLQQDIFRLQVKDYLGACCFQSTSKQLWSKIDTTISDNPYHNQHIKEITACIDDTVMELQSYYDAILLMMQQQIDELTARVEQLEAQSKKSHTVDVFARLNT